MTCISTLIDSNIPIAQQAAGIITHEAEAAEQHTDSVSDIEATLQKESAAEESETDSASGVETAESFDADVETAETAVTTPEPEIAEQATVSVWDTEAVKEESDE
jgi:hypothetical protein